MSLKQDTTTFMAEAAKQLPPEVLTRLERSIDDLRTSSIVARALGVGDRAPSFTLPNAQGRPVALVELLRTGPLIVSFYRGAWCPYCNLELRAYQGLLGEIRVAGGDFIAISPQTPDNSLSSAQKHASEFEVLSDHRNRVGGQFGIAYYTPAVVKEITDSFGVNLATINGADDDRLPISATYVIDTQGRIAFASIDPDFRARLEPDDALAALRRLTSVAADGAPVRDAGAAHAQP